MKTILIFLLGLSLSLHAQLEGIGAEPSRGNLALNAKSVKPGESFIAYLTIDNAPGYHAYYNNPGNGSGFPPSITWELPKGFTAGPLMFPAPEVHKISEGREFIYNGKSTFSVKITTSKNLAVGQTFDISASADWLACNDEGCLPNNHTANLSILTSEKTENQKVEGITPLPTDISSQKITAVKVSDTLSIQLTGNDWKNLPQPNIDKLKFYEFAGLFTMNKPIKITKISEGVTISGTLSPDATKEQLKSIQGIIATTDPVIPGTFSNTAWINVPLNVEGNVPEKATTTKVGKTNGHSLDSMKNVSTPQEVAAMLKLYDVESKIDFVTLDQISEDGTLSGKKSDKTSYLTFLLFAFIGGAILNLMPCIFPVLGVKVLGFAQLSGNDPKKIKMHGIVFALGMLVSMWILAGIFLALRESTGNNISWGEQMGNPYFVGIMIIFLTLFGMNLYGVFEIGTSLTSAGGNLQQKKGYQGSFWSGVLTTVIATPCSGPFLGATLGFALKESVPSAMLIFTIFALGIASPYIILSFFPSLINKLPRPGAWMITFKKIMAFPMFGTAVFLMFSFGKQTGTDGLSWMLMALVVIGLAAFIYGQWSLPHISKIKRYTIGWGMAALILLAGAWLAKDAMDRVSDDDSGTEGWAQWHPGIVPYSRAQEKIVWVDYTAHW